MRIKRSIIIFAVLALLGGLASCQSSTQGQKVQPGQPVTLTGLMEEGPTPIGLTAYETGTHLLATSTPLANYKLYCVTFESSPVASTGTADNSGKFSLTIKSYTPFGCFVLDTTGTHIADLLFAGLGESAGSYSGSIMLTNNVNVGTITVDPAKGIAVVDLSGKTGVSGSATAPFDPTGAWNFTCTTSPSNDPVYSCPPPQDAPTSIYLDRISATFADGKKHYGMGVWTLQGYNACGKVEGISPTPDSTSGLGPNGHPITLDRPDGPFNYVYDNVWQKSLNIQPKNTQGVCGAPTTETCSNVTNVAGWHTISGNSLLTPGQCQQTCYADSVHDLAQANPTSCIEDRSYLWNVDPPTSPPINDTSTAFVKFLGTPISRLMFGELIYSSNTSASVVDTEDDVETIWVHSSNGTDTSYICRIQRITHLSIYKIDTNTISATLDQYVKLSDPTPPSQCSDTKLPHNDVAQEIASPMHVMFKLTK